MQYFPLIWFITLSFFYLKKRGVNVCTYISFLYVLTSFFSVLLFEKGMVPATHDNPSFFSTLVYCGLITLTIIPSYYLDSNKLLFKANIKVIEAFCIVYLVSSILFLILYYKSIVFIIAFGDFAALRGELLQNGSLGIVQLSGIMNIIASIVAIISSTSFVLILFFFISITYYQKKWYFNLILFLESLISILYGILNVNRSSVFYYFIFFGLCVVIFWRRLSFKVKAAITPVILLVFIAILGYFYAVSNDRFAESDQGTQGGLIEYAGQPYHNFCYFFDNYQNPSGELSTRFLLPFTNHILNGYNGGTQREAELEAISNYDCNVFMTFLGSFIMDCNQLAPFMFVLLYFFVFSIIKHRHKRGALSMSWLIFYYVYVSIPSIGIISYYYNQPWVNFSLFLVFLACNKFYKHYNIVCDR